METATRRRRSSKPLARPKEDARRIHFHGQKFRTLLARHGYETLPQIAALLGVGLGTVHRACTDAQVGGEFILAVRLVLPALPYEEFFWEA